MAVLWLCVLAKMKLIVVVFFLLRRVLSYSTHAVLMREENESGKMGYAPELVFIASVVKD